MRRGLILITAVIAVSVIGYRFFGRGWIDALYMVTITVATVGFGEESRLSPSEQLYTIAVMLFGITAVAYTFGSFLQFITAGELERALGQRRMEHDIQQLRDHTVICGYGRIGNQLAGELRKRAQPLLVIEQNEDRAAAAQADGCLVIRGNATEEEILKRANLDRAKALVTVLPSDAENVFITLTAKELKRDLRIIARAEQVTTEKKLFTAGATHIVAPAAVGAQRIAAMITRPSTVELVDLVTDRSFVDIEMDELVVPSLGPLVGKNLEQADFRFDKLLLVGIKRTDGSLAFNPGKSHVFQAGETIILMGPKSDIEQFRSRAGV